MATGNSPVFAALLDARLRGSTLFSVLLSTFEAEPFAVGEAANCAVDEAALIYESSVFSQ